MKTPLIELTHKNQVDYKISVKSKTEYCLQYFAAQNKLVKKTNFAS